MSLSHHRLLATYDRDLDAAALQVSSYSIYSTQAVNLPVDAVSRASNNQAFLMTGPQDPVTYEVKKPKTSRPIKFTGSTASEPRLVSVRPLSMTQIVVGFSEPIGNGALLPSSYQITVDGSTATLAVTGVAVFGSTGKEVLLTTAPQEGLPYVLKVGDIQGTSGTYMDPTATTLQFAGSTVPPGPMLLNATADGGTRVILTFDTPLDPDSAADPANYTATPNLFIASATLQSENRQVVLETGQQYQLQYSLVANVTGADGNPVNPGFNSVSFTGTGDAISSERPKVVSAASTSNKSVVVQFSKPMADSTADSSRFVIVQTVVHPEVGALTISKAEFVDGARLSVRLTTLSQAEVTYQVTANNVTDVLGNPLADKTNVAGVIVDPTSFTFPGTPPTGDERTNSDCTPDACDTLYDHEETRGWQINIKLGNGDTQVRQVTSSPFSADTDNDGLKDHEERALNIDPRDNDTDDDGITDYSEFNEFYSDPANQDSDGDGLFDGLEATFFFTSPIFDDTDGDQLKDGYEINVNRNAKVADLPQPLLTLGDMRLGLDVKFTESNGETTRELDSKTVESTLTQSQEQLYSRSESTTHEVATKAAFQTRFMLEWGFEGLAAKAGKTLEFTGSTETTNTNSWTSDFTDTSSTATQQAYTNSLSTQQEVAKDSNVTRDVYGARVQLGVFLEGRGNLAFTARNLQVAALIQDEENPARLTPIATLVPTTGLETSFNLGPLVPPKGPIVFTSTDASPELVEQLMENPRGLIFRFSNYDIVDEAGRNFAFVSQDINDRTARIAIDYGGFDANGDGRGEESEILRVATGVMGRHAVDTNGDGVVNQDDRKVVFDTSGKQVGITLRDALAAAGLKWYDESDPATKSDALSPEQRRNSFSTIKTTDGSGEVIFRVRERRIKLDAPQQWLVVTPNGIDPLARLDQRILYPGSTIELGFVADEDEDRLPALIEATNGCSESPETGADGKFKSRDTDVDGLDDRFEVLSGWDVNTLLYTGRVHASCRSTDSDGDRLSDRDEAPAIINYDASGLVLFNDGISAPRSVSDLKTTSGSPIVESATADFTFLDVGAVISGSGIPDNAKIASVQSPTKATMTANATATLPRSVDDLKTTSLSAIIESATTGFTSGDVGAAISGSGIPDGTTIASVQSSTKATMTANATATASEVTASITAASPAVIGALYADENAPRRDTVGSAPRVVSDLKTTSGSALVASASANFTGADVGKAISGAGILQNTSIVSVHSPTQARLTANATATAPAVSATIGGFAGRSVSDLVTADGSATVTSASAKFTSRDVGVTISGPGIPDNTTIEGVQSLTEATMTAKATATAASGVQASLGQGGFVDQALFDPVTDPQAKDTDLDGLDDGFELTAYKNALEKPFRKTSPEHPDTDADSLYDGVERKLGADPRFSDRAEFWDSDRDGLTDAQEVADDDLDFVIEDSEKAGAGWDVAVTQMHLGLASPSDPYSAVARIPNASAPDKRHLVDRGQSLQVGMIVDIKNEQSTEAALNTSVDKIEPIAGTDDAHVTFGTAFTGGGQNVYSTVCKNGKCPAQHSTVTRKVYSSKYDADTDDDGLTDYEEYGLKTDPGDPSDEKDTDGDGIPDSWDTDRDGVRDSLDTDGDGLTDVQEVRGFKLADGSTVKTKPTYVDTDNDRRSDGDEAGLPGGEFIVRLPAGNIYQASTHPLKADTDLDQMVDGDEQAFGIDPTKPNTDGDNLSDYSEVFGGRRPEVADMHVKLDFVRLFVAKDAEPGEWANGTRDHGDFMFSFDVLKPNAASELVVQSDDTGGATQLPLQNCTSDAQSLCWVTLEGRTIVRIQEGESLPLGKQVVIGSVSTTDAVPEQFGIQGYVEERDGDKHENADCRVEIFPDLFGGSQDGTGLMKGSALRSGVQSMAIHRAVDTCGSKNPLEFTLVMSYTAT